MQKLAEVCIKRPVFATMIVMALVVVGAASYFRLGVDRFPAVDLPTVSVRVELPGASTEEIETQLTQKLEEQINTIQGIQELRSISTPGNSLVIVTFALSRNIDVAAQDVRDKVSIAQRNLPRDVKPPIISKFDNDQSPVLTIAGSVEASSVPAAIAPSSRAFAPGSANGILAEFTHATAGSLMSKMPTRKPREAKATASGRPT